METIEELNLGETDVESNEFHLLINTSCTIVGTVERRELITEKKW